MHMKCIHNNFCERMTYSCLETLGNISKKPCAKRYCSYHKACQFSDL